MNFIQTYFKKEVSIGSVVLVFILVMIGFILEWTRRSLLERRLEKNRVLEKYYFLFYQFLNRLHIYTKPLEVGDPDTTDWEIKMEALMKDYRELQYLTDMHFIWLRKNDYFMKLILGECLDALKSVWIGASLKDRDYGFIDQGKLRQKQRKLARIVAEQEVTVGKMMTLIVRKRRVRL